jgi:hypothetical protein
MDLNRQASAESCTVAAGRSGTGVDCLRRFLLGLPATELIDLEKA